MSDELPAEREPVRVGKTPRPAGVGGGERRTAAEKLARRLAGLPAGRYEVIVTVGEDGVLRDWSVRFFGKVEGV